MSAAPASYLRTSVPPYLRTSVPPYLRTSVPSYLRTSVPPYRGSDTDADADVGADVADGELRVLTQVAEVGLVAHVAHAGVDRHRPEAEAQPRTHLVAGAPVAVQFVGVVAQL